MLLEPPLTSRPDVSEAQRTALEQRLLRARQAAKPGSRPVIIPRPHVPRVPLSHAQERLWFLDQLLSDRSIYNVCQVMRLTGTLNVPALQGALDEITRRHDVFRTTIVASDDGPLQVITHPAHLPLAQADLSGLASEQRQSELSHRLETHAKRPFDLTKDQLIRALLVRLGPEEHVLMLVMHHIVSDGWTLGLLVREIAVLHETFSSGLDSPLPPLPISFADFALWERETFQGEALEKALGYWRRQLDGATSLELLTDRQRPATPSLQGATQSRHLSAELVRDLRVLSQREGATLFMTLLAGFQALMHRYTGQDDIVLGSCVAGRSQVELENLAGFFVNTLVLRTDAGGQPRFRELLARTRETVLGAMAHQELPFEKIVAALQPDRSPARNPFFQIMFVLQSASGAPPEASGLKFESLEFNNGTAKFDLTFSLAETSDGLFISVEYRTDLFEPATMARLLGHYHVLIASAAADPTRRLAELPLLTAAERAELVDEWSGSRIRYPREVTVVDLFREQARRTPQSLAVTDATTRLTYRELDERSNRLAHFLQRHGAGPGALVALCLDRSPHIAITLLAILKTGAAYVSLDPGYPAARLELMLADCRPAVVVTQDHLRHLLTGGEQSAGPALVSLEAAREEIANQPSTALSTVLTADSLAYVSYTSGSTGRPKGVCVPHRGIVRLVCETDYLHFGRDETFLQFAPVAFDASTLEIWGALLHGGRLAVFPAGLPSLSELAGFITQQGVSTTFLTTGLFNQLVDEQLERLGGLRQLVTGGEVMSTAHAARVRARFPHLRLINGYGPTENTTFTTTHPVIQLPRDGGSIPIGRPIANTTVYLLDPLRQPVPIGVPGELYTGGDGLATGYLGRPDLDAERFVAHPFDATPGARLYRTGDLARWLPDGTIEFLGRVDRQIKLRGFRLEPGEIETVLSQHPAVAQAAVLLDQVAGQDARLIAYVTPRTSIPPDPAELRGYLQKHLPDYMVPAVVMPVPAIPLNANGKVDRSALPQVSAAPTTGRPPVLPPRDPVETKLVAIWEQILGVSPIGVQDNFFQLGGHSMAGVRLFSHLEKEFGRRLPLAALFECPTLEQLAARLREPGMGAACSSLVAIQPRGTRPAVFFVHGAGGGNLWTYTALVPHLGPDQPVYGLESRGMRGLPEFDRIEDMAAHYLREIRTVQPQGPYYLSGYCFGGNVAYEMARQLEASGEKVALLALLDSAAANSTYQQIPWWQPIFYVRFALNTARWLREFLVKPAHEQQHFLRRKTAALSRRLFNRMRGLPDATTVDEVIDTSIFPEIELNLWKIHLHALSNYRPAAYGGRIVLFRTNGHPFLCSFDPKFGWGPLAAGGVDEIPLPGAHEGIFMEPHVRQVSSLFRTQLHHVQTNHTSRPLSQ